MKRLLAALVFGIALFALLFLQGRHQNEARRASELGSATSGPSEPFEPGRDAAREAQSETDHERQIVADGEGEPVASDGPDADGPDAELERVVGRVVGAGRFPVPGAEVVVREGERVVARASANGEGRFAFDLPRTDAGFGPGVVRAHDDQGNVAAWPLIQARAEEGAEEYTLPTLVLGKRSRGFGARG